MPVQDSKQTRLQSLSTPPLIMSQPKQTLGRLLSPFSLQVKGSPLHPTCLQLLVPPREGAIKYYGDRSGELATFINQTIPGRDVALDSLSVPDETRCRSL